jgi:hypothetical protein
VVPRRDARDVLLQGVVHDDDARGTAVEEAARCERARPRQRYDRALGESIVAFAARGFAWRAARDEVIAMLRTVG